MKIIRSDNIGNENVFDKLVMKNVPDDVGEEIADMLQEKLSVNGDSEYWWRAVSDDYVLHSPERMRVIDIFDNLFGLIDSVLNLNYEDSRKVRNSIIAAQYTYVAGKDAEIEVKKND